MFSGGHHKVAPRALWWTPPGSPRSLQSTLLGGSSALPWIRCVYHGQPESCVRLQFFRVLAVGGDAAGYLAVSLSRQTEV